MLCLCLSHRIRHTGMEEEEGIHMGMDIRMEEGTDMGMGIVDTDTGMGGV